MMARPMLAQRTASAPSTDPFSLRPAHPRPKLMRSGWPNPDWIAPEGGENRASDAASFLPLGLIRDGSAFELARNERGGGFCAQ